MPFCTHAAQQHHIPDLSCGGAGFSLEALISVRLKLYGNNANQSQPVITTPPCYTSQSLATASVVITAAGQVSNLVLG